MDSRHRPRNSRFRNVIDISLHQHGSTILPGGTAVAMLSPIGLLAPVFYDWIYDTMGSYDNAFTVALGLASSGRSCHVFCPISENAG
jgi:hypothetical protein